MPTIEFTIPNRYLHHFCLKKLGNIPNDQQHNMALDGVRSNPCAEASGQLLKLLAQCTTAFRKSHLAKLCVWIMLTIQPIG